MYSYLDSNGSPWAAIHPPAVGADSRDFWVVERLRLEGRRERGAESRDAPVRRRPAIRQHHGRGSPQAYEDVHLRTPRSGEFGLARQLAASSHAVARDERARSRAPTSRAGAPTRRYNYEAYIFSLVDGIKTPS